MSVFKPKRLKGDKCGRDLIFAFAFPLFESLERNITDKALRRDFVAQHSDFACVGTILPAKKIWHNCIHYCCGTPCVQLLG